jgi:hypothetical protein
MSFYIELPMVDNTKSLELHTILTTLNAKIELSKWNWSIFYYEYNIVLEGKKIPKEVLTYFKNEKKAGLSISYELLTDFLKCFLQTIDCRICGTSGHEYINIVGFDSDTWEIESSMDLSYIQHLLPE